MVSVCPFPRSRAVNSWNSCFSDGKGFNTNPCSHYIPTFHFISDWKEGCCNVCPWKQVFLYTYFGLSLKWYSRSDFKLAVASLGEAHGVSCWSFSSSSTSAFSCIWRGRCCLRPLSMTWWLVTLEMWVFTAKLTLCSPSVLTSYAHQVPPTVAFSITPGILPPMMLYTRVSSVTSKHHTSHCLLHFVSCLLFSFERHFLSWQSPFLSEGWPFKIPLCILKSGFSLA